MYPNGQGILVELFTLFFTLVSKVFWETIQVVVVMMHFDARFTAKLKFSASVIKGDCSLF